MFFFHWRKKKPRKWSVNISTELPILLTMLNLTREWDVGLIENVTASAHTLYWLLGDVIVWWMWRLIVYLQWIRLAMWSDYMKDFDWFWIWFFHFYFPYLLEKRFYIFHYSYVSIQIWSITYIHLHKNTEGVKVSFNRNVSKTFQRGKQESTRCFCERSKVHTELPVSSSTKTKG